MLTHATNVTLQLCNYTYVCIPNASYIKRKVFSCKHFIWSQNSHSSNVQSGRYSLIYPTKINTRLWSHATKDISLLNFSERALKYWILKKNYTLYQVPLLDMYEGTKTLSNRYKESGVLLGRYNGTRLLLGRLKCIVSIIQSTATKLQVL